MLNLILFIFLSSAFAQEFLIDSIPINTATHVQQHITYFDSDSKDIPMIVLRAKETDPVDGSRYKYYQFRLADLTLKKEKKRNLIYFQNVLCAKQWPILKNYRKVNCELKSVIHRDDVWFHYDLYLQTK